MGFLLLVVWMLYVWPWVHNPTSPASILYYLGLKDIEHEHVWMATDAIASMLTLLFAGRKFWGWAIWGCFISMLFAHVAAELFPMEFEPYSRSLDAAFLGQIAILFWLGGDGVRDRVSRFITRLRRSDVPKLASHLEG